MEILCIFCMGILPIFFYFLIIVLLIHKNKEIEKIVLDIGKCHLELLVSHHEKPV